MKTIITHFYNEEYLLPIWLKHHKKYFDHGILIDYHSTDRSIEICREICPDWEIITSKHEFFDARDNDLEVAELEKNIPGWKMSLTVTEFIVGDIDKLCVDSDQRLQYTVPLIIFTGYDPNGQLDTEKPFWEQVKMGLTFMTHQEAWPSRSLHNFNDIVYPGGRHFYPHNTTEAMIFKYSNCLIGPEMIKRRLQINSKVSVRDKVEGIGSHHCVTMDTIEEYYNTNIGSKNPIDCTDIINNLTKKSKYTTYVFSNKPHKFPAIVESAKPEIVNYYDGTNAESFSKIVNSCVQQAPTEMVIFCSDKYLPTQHDIQKIVSLLDQGYALVAYYKFVCFAFKKELFRKIGVLDERFLNGGYEDFDFYLRCREANLSVYLSDEGSYTTGPSSWNYSIPWAHWCKKWVIHGEEFDPKCKRIVERVLPEPEHNYDFGPSVPTKFLPAKDSKIKISDGLNGHYQIFQWTIRRKTGFQGK